MIIEAATWILNRLARLSPDYQKLEREMHWERVQLNAAENVLKEVGPLVKSRSAYARENAWSSTCLAYELWENQKRRLREAKDGGRSLVRLVDGGEHGK